MTAIATPSTTITREIPSNQVSTMAAYPNPSYPMSPGAEAIRAAVGRMGRSGERPMYTSAAQIMAGAQNPLLQGAQQQPNGLGALSDAFGGGNAPTPDDVAAFQAMQSEVQNPQAGVDPNVETMGPTAQTAAGGIMGSPEFTTPAAWTQFFDQRGTRPGVAPVAPPVMAGSRVGNNYIPGFTPAGGAANAGTRRTDRVGSSMLPAAPRQTYT